jgi:hypothetical protein
MNINNTEKTFKTKDSLLKYIKNHGEGSIYPNVVSFENSEDEEYKFLIKSLIDKDNYIRNYAFELLSENFGCVCINIGNDIKYEYIEKPKPQKIIDVELHIS